MTRKSPLRGPVAANRTNRRIQCARAGNDEEGRGDHRHPPGQLPGLREPGTVRTGRDCGLGFFSDMPVRADGIIVPGIARPARNSDRQRYRSAERMPGDIAIILRLAADDLDVFSQPDIGIVAVFPGPIRIQRGKAELARIVHRANRCRNTRLPVPTGPARARDPYHALPVSGTGA